jgi:hypothetical protein
MGAPAKSKVSTGAPSYALAWMIFDPVHSCATVCALCWLGSPLEHVVCRALEQRVKGWLHTIYFVGFKCFPTLCIPVPPFVLFVGLSHPWRVLAIRHSRKM